MYGRKVRCLAAFVVGTVFFLLCSTLSFISTTTEENINNVRTASNNGALHSSNSNNGQCPLSVRKNTGLFDKSKSDSAVKDDFRDVILLVSCNYAYYNMLQNWEYFANELNIKWAVLALDDDLYDELGPERAISPGDLSVSGLQSFRKGDFNKLSCNKMRMVLNISENCDVDVVFSDADNIFYKNPFEHDLGRLIKSKRPEGNTGFYYFSRKSKLLKKMYESTLERCDDPENELDDQSLFWEELWKNRMNERDTTFSHCRHAEYLDPSNVNLEEAQGDSSFDFCCMDPYYYPVGNHNTTEGPLNKDPITYHANFAKGYEAKVKKLVYSRGDHHGWNKSRFIDGNGGILGKRETGK